MENRNRECKVFEKEMSMEKKKSNQEIIDSYDYLGSACSARDCTGLIPANPPDAFGRDSYEDIYHFLAKPASASDEGPNRPDRESTTG